MSLVFHPPIPFALSLILGFAVLGVWLYLGRSARSFWPSFAIRCAAVGLALFALAGPSKEIPKARAGGKPRLTVLVDTSASMAEEGRLEQAWQAALHAQKTCGTLAEVSVLDLAGHALAGQPKADAPQSDLVGAVRAARGADAVLLISDGRATLLPAGDWPAALKADLGGAPVYAVPVGEAKPGTAPLRLDAWADAEVAYPRQEVGFSVQVTGRPGQQVTLDLRAGTEALGSPRTVVIPVCGVVPVDFACPVPAGAQGAWRIRVTAQSEEGAAVVAEVPVQIAPGPARVLLLEGAPCIHTREIARALEEDPCAALVAVYDLGPRRLIVRSGEPVVAQAIPQAIDDQTLSAFDVVILGARLEVFFPDASSMHVLAQFAKQGGGILFARGDGLADGMPALRAGTHEVVLESPVRIGETHPAFWRQTVAKLANHGQAMAAEERLKKSKPAAEASMDREMADIRPNPALLETLCEATGGRLLAGDDFAPLTQELVRLQPAEAGESEFEPAFNRLWLLAAFIGLLAVDFALRRRRGQA